MTTPQTAQPPGIDVDELRLVIASTRAYADHLERLVDRLDPPKPTTDQVRAGDLARHDRIMVRGEPGWIVEAVRPIGPNTVAVQRQDGVTVSYHVDETVPVQLVDCPECEGEILSGAPCSTCRGKGKATGGAARAWRDAAFERPCISEPGDLDEYLPQLEIARAGIIDEDGTVLAEAVTR